MALELALSLIETYSVSTIGFADITDFGTHNPTNAAFEITAPGFNKINVTFTPKSVNIYNASHLSVDCDHTTALPDGVYTIKYSIFPNSTNFIERNFMRTSLIDCKIERAFLGIDSTLVYNSKHSYIHPSTRSSCMNDMNKKQILRTIRLLVESSIAAANQCDVVGAMDMYRKADSMLNELSSCHC